MGLPQAAGVDRRIPYSFGSAVMLAGAFAVGWVLHQVFVRGTLSVTAPPSVIGLALGLALIAVGRALERRFDPSSYVTRPPDDDDEEAFDEDYSPLSAGDLEGYERDEARE